MFYKRSMPSFVKDSETRYPKRHDPPFEKLLPPRVYQLRLAELEDYHMEVECGCGCQRNLSIQGLIKVHGGPRQIFGRVLNRLKCSQCHARPSEILLNECMIKHAAYGPPCGWSVQVWPVTGQGAE